MKKIFIALSVFCLASHFAKGQNPYQPNITGANPVTPSAYQFTKYTELPVSEYTGIPNISIPLYEIKEDDITLPVDLTYHSVGIRVNQEAGWVGLGWDLNFGSIVQNINDVDDFFNFGKTSGSPGYQPMTKLLPDFSNNPGYPWEYPFAYNFSMDFAPANPNPLVPGYFPVIAPQVAYGFKIATDYYIPVNGTYQQNTGFFTDHQGQYGFFDSEPDIFTANFLGHSLTFMLDWTNPLSYNVIVLNKKGYQVNRLTTTSWEIITPEGDQFYFETENSISSYSAGYGLFGSTFSGTVQPTSNIWLLTRIVTQKNKQITINYSSNGNVANFPDYSEVWQSPALLGTAIYGGSAPPETGYTRGYTQNVGVSQTGWGPEFNGVNPMWANSTEQKFYPSSIAFENGLVNFYTSASADMLGGMKLDSLRILSNINKLVNSYKFNYSYFDTLTSPGNGFTYPSSFGVAASLRLKLLSISRLDNGVYTFTYDPHPLPKKNSFAQDYWGYYNGQITNTSLTPNPAQLNMPSLGNNGNNHSAFLSYARAGILTGVRYPTGGGISLQYGLNQFNNYWVPDSSSSANTVSHGDGLRVACITINNNGFAVMKQFYGYNTGKAIYPISMFKYYGLTTLGINSTTYPSPTITEQDYNVTEISSQGFYSSNPLITNSGVGYDTVTKTMDSLGLVLGKTVTSFVNNPAVGSCLFTGQSLSATLPVVKPLVPENGSINSVQYFNNANNIVKNEVYAYTINASPIYYGARLFGYSNLVSEFEQLNTWQVITEPQSLIGFYPIYDFETLPFSKVTTEYGGGNSLVTTEGFTYDQYDQLTSHSKYTPAYYTMDYFEHPGSFITYYSDWPSKLLLYNANRFSDVLMSNRVQGPYPYQNQIVSSYYKHYETIGGAPVESYVTVNKNLISPAPLADTISYDSYDTVFKNPLQVTSQKTSNCMIWDYSGVYPIAEVKNATIGNVAYTSFEADGSGNWTIPSSARDVSRAITGNSSYALTSANISRTGLTSGNMYIVSYWSTGGSYSVSGTTGIVTGKTISINGVNWTYYEHTITGITSIVISGSGNIDELRLYPKASQMTTYTYSPLIGMTSQCDMDNHITYYSYDAAGRLQYIKDQDGNIIKTFGYHYQGQ